MANVIIEEVNLEIIEEENNEVENDDLIIMEKGIVILDLESLIVEASQDNHIGPYSMLEYLEPYIEAIYDYTLALKREYDGDEDSCCACDDCKCLES